MKSVKDNFRKLQGVFILLAILITAQMIILYFLQSQQSGNIKLANELNSDYMHLLTEKNKLFSKIYRIKDKVDPETLLTVQAKFKKIRDDIGSWGAKGVDANLVTDSTLKEEYKRLSSIQKAFSMYVNGNVEEADKILELEKRVFFDRAPVVESILNSLMEDTRKAGAFITVFFFVIILLNVPVFVILLMLTRQFFNSFKNDISKLTKVAKSISHGDPVEVEEESSIEETAELLEAFKELELELINRNMLTKDEVTRTKKTKENLEQQVVQSSHELVKANELLENKNKELEQILYAASHDLRTPLIGVQGFSQELQYLCDTLKEEVVNGGISLEEGTKIQEILENDIPNSVNYIINGSNKMDTMIQGLLRISRVGLEDLKMEEIDMSEFVRQIVDGLSFQAQSANAMILTGDLENCVGDKEKLEQVFTNLIVNAIKYRKSENTCEINISCERVDDELHYVIADNGIGISDENLNKIFNTFFRIDSEEGTGEGLGLTIANRIIEKHKGRLKVESTEGEGSRFIIILPVNQEVSTDE